MPVDTATIIAIGLTAAGMLAAAVYAIARIESSASGAADAVADHEHRLDDHERRIHATETDVAVIKATQRK